MQLFQDFSSHDREIFLVRITFRINYFWTVNRQSEFIFEKSFHFDINIVKKFLRRARAKTFVNKNAIKSCLGLFQAKVGKFQNGWERFWEFDDICWDFLCFGSSHTGRAVRVLQLKIIPFIALVNRYQTAGKTVSEVKGREKLQFLSCKSLFAMDLCGVGDHGGRSGRVSVMSVFFILVYFNILWVWDRASSIDSTKLFCQEACSLVPISLQN